MIKNHFKMSNWLPLVGDERLEIDLKFEKVPNLDHRSGLDSRQSPGRYMQDAVSHVGKDGLNRF